MHETVLAPQQVLKYISGDKDFRWKYYSAFEWQKGKVPVKAEKGMEGCVTLTLTIVEKLQKASLVCWTASGKKKHSND